MHDKINSMKSTGILLKILLFLMLSISLWSFDLPKSWFKAGSDPDSYQMGTDKGAGKDGKNAATIKSKDKKIKGFGTLMQTSLPGIYAGKRVGMSGLLKSENVEKWAGYWLRVDAIGTNESLAFDNMNTGEDRSIKGTTGWNRYEIVLDVHPDAANLAYGALLVGTEQIWFDDIKFEVVDDSVPTTGEKATDTKYNEQPANLDFDE